MWLSWESACLACTKPWLESPAPHKLIVVEHACNLNTQEVDAEGAEVHDCLGSLRLAWDT